MRGEEVMKCVRYMANCVVCQITVICYIENRLLLPDGCTARVLYICLAVERMISVYSQRLETSMCELEVRCK